VPVHPLQDCPWLPASLSSAPHKHTHSLALSLSMAAREPVISSTLARSRSLARSLSRSLSMAAREPVISSTLARSRSLARSLSPWLPGSLSSEAPLYLCIFRLGLGVAIASKHRLKPTITDPEPRSGFCMSRVCYPQVCYTPRAQ